MIHIEDGKKAFGNLVVFDALNLLIDKPGLYFIQGKSGSGKSTLLNLLAGFDCLDSGSIEIDKNVTTIFQNYELIQDLTVEENIFLEVDPDVSGHYELIDELGLTNLLKNYPTELSGGQKQRVGIARALLLNPNIILCDEPTESLDIENKIIVMELLKKVSRDKIVIVASHDLKMTDEYAEHVFYLEDHCLISKNPYICNRDMNYENKKDFKVHVVSKMVHKITVKRTILLNLVVLLLCCALQSLYLYDRKLFYVPTSTAVLNADMIYFEVLGSNEKYQTDEYAKILKFEETFKEDVKYDWNVYPYVMNTKELVIKGDIPKGKGVLVNQNVLKELDIKDWKEVSLRSIYMLGSLEKEMDFHIVGVIYEEDTDLKNVYYNLEDIMNILDSLEYDDGLTYKNFIDTYGMNFQKKVGFNAIKDTYQSLSNKNEAYLRSPLYDERVNMLSGREIFQFVFKTIQISLFILIVLFVFISMNYDANSYLRTCSILSSMGMDLMLLKHLYLKEKLQYLLPLLVIESFLVFVVGFTQLSKSLVVMDYLVLGVMLMAVIGVYLFALLMEMKKIKVEKIAQILKNDN